MEAIFASNFDCMDFHCLFKLKQDIDVGKSGENIAMTEEKGQSKANNEQAIALNKNVLVCQMSI